FTGTVNAWYLVGSVRALFDTAYGQLLVVKLVLFAAMLALAATNRLVWTPGIERGDRRAGRMLVRSAIGESLLGVAIVAIVAALGASVPAAHVRHSTHHMAATTDDAR